MENQTGFIKWLWKIAAFAFVVGSSVLSVWLTRISATSLVYERRELKIPQTNLKIYALLFGLLCFLLYVGTMIGLVLFVSVCMYAYDKYYKMGFRGILLGMIYFVTTGFNEKDKTALLWVAIISAFVMMLTLLLLSEQGRDFLNAYYTHHGQLKRTTQTEDGRVIYEDIDDPERDALLSKTDGAGFLFKLYEMGHLIYPVVLAITTEVIFVVS